MIELILIILLIFCSTGKEEREREKLRADLLKRGNQLRTELSVKGKALKDEQLNRLEELKKSIAEAQLLKEERENIKRDAETLESAALATYKEALDQERAARNEESATHNADEARDTFMRFDSNGNGLLEIVELQTRIQFDRNRDGAVTDDEARFFLDQRDQVDFDTFITLSWPRIKPYLMKEAGLFTPPSSIGELKDSKNELYDEDEEGEREQLEPLEPARETEELAEEEEYEEEETGEGEVSRRLFNFG